MKKRLERLFSRIRDWFDPTAPAPVTVTAPPLYQVEVINGQSYVVKGNLRILSTGYGLDGMRRAQTQSDLLNHHPAIQRAIKAAAA